MDETQLKLLNQLQKDPSFSQRRLSRELGVSLGKVNYCLKALAEKGWVKMESFIQSNHKAGYLYVLTPRGIRRKAVLTVKFLQRKETEYKRLSAEIEQLRAEVRELDKNPHSHARRTRS